LAVAVPTFVQLGFPGLLDALSRDADKMADGQIWRFVTSAVVQDGGAAGTVFNLFALAVVATVAVMYWGGARTWVVFWAGAVATNVAVLWWNPTGGGNSMATFVLVGALTSSILTIPERRRAAWRFALLVLLGMLVLLAGLNYHVVACGIGLPAGLLPVLRADEESPEASTEHRLQPEGGTAERRS
jgi:membrane associated rhomboid family serine protease